MSQPRTVLVAGATGKQGGDVARALIERGHVVRAMTRTPDSAAAARLAQAGAAIVAGDFTDPASLVAAMDDAETAFFMGTPMGEGGAEAEARQGFALVEAAEKAGVGHVIYSSVASADRNTGIPHFDSKFAVEQRLQEARSNWTIVAPVAFMNFLAPPFADGLRTGEFRFGTASDRAVQYVDTIDIGAAVAEVVSMREGALGWRLELAGDERAGADVAAVLSRAAGRDIRYVQMPIEAVRSFSTDLALMFEWFERVGYDVDREALRAKLPGLRWHCLEEWAAKQDWQGALAAAA